MSYQAERTLRQEIVDVHRRLYELGFSVANDGNTSVRLEDKRLLITPAGLNKAKLRPEQLAIVDMEGKTVGGNFSPSSEIAMHLAIYKARADIQAIVHAHPPYAIACSLAKVSLAEYVLPEVITTLGQIPTAPYTAPGYEEVGKVAAELIKKYDGIILDRHGSVTVGKTLEEAMTKLERIEHTAKITAIAKAMGSVTPLPKNEVERLVGVHEPTAPPLSTTSSSKPVDEALIELITREVRAALDSKS